MKNLLPSFVVFIFILNILFSCDKESAPTCTITSPASGNEIEQGTIVSISVDADDTDGSITEIRFYIDGSNVGSSSSKPYKYDWNTADVIPGKHNLKVTAEDDDDLLASDELEITIVITGNSPVASFSASATSITKGESIQFTDESANEPTAWLWDFGDGSTSTEKNPLYTYLATGTYSVSLEATNSFGSNTETRTDYITIGSPPIAAFIASSKGVVEEESILFTDQTNNEPTSWAWDFGDGGTSTSQNPSYSYSTAGPYTVSLTATNSFGTDTVTKTNYITVFKSITDYDGNVYKIIEIGSQTWMAENLKSTHYADGKEIQLIENTNDWDNLGYEDKAMCYYNNNVNSEANTYGALYTWAAAMNGAASSDNNPSGIQGVCPSGWHLPSDAEWTELTDYFGGEFVAGGLMKETGTSHWLSPNTGATNVSGFTALPGGSRYRNGSFHYLRYDANFWSTTEYDASRVWYRLLYYDDFYVVRRYNYKKLGFSARCIKD